MKNVRKFKKIDFKHKKATLDLNFLLACKEKKIPNFLRFQVVNKQLKSSNAYSTCLKRLLNQEISNKHKVVESMKQILKSIKNKLHHDTCFIDFVYVTKIRNPHGKNFHYLLLTTVKII